MKISMPAGAEQIIHTLESHGFQGYIVGGCVRDACLGRTPNDWDITTNASPLQVKELFRRTVDTGIAHGTVTVMDGSDGYEVTTYRIDGEYEDGRHPSSVTFTSKLGEDLRRRDFTINAMAYNDHEGLVDLFGGMEDLDRRVIRCVGNPEERFTEDALRIMRAVRFASQLDYTIDEKTAAAAERLAPSLKKISAERVCTELMKLLTGAHPERLETAWQLGITAQVLPEFDDIMELEQTGVHHDLSVGRHTLLALTQIEASPLLRLTMLLHDMGKAKCGVRDAEGNWQFPGHAALSAQMAARITRRLKMDRDTMKRSALLCEVHSAFPDAQDSQIRILASEIGQTNFEDYLKVKRADLLAQKSGTVQRERLRHLDEVAALWQEIRQRRDPLRISDLAVSGRDLIALGIKPGPEMGDVLNKLLERVLMDPAYNQKEVLTDLVKKGL